MTTLLIATRNAHKVEEIRAILGTGFHFLTLREYPGAPPVIEDADTFAGNARKKALELARWLMTEAPPAAREQLNADAFVLADDSGLEVDALNGAPGVHSARFAALDTGREGNSSDAENKAKLLRLLRNVPAEKRAARFRCVIALASPKPCGGDDDTQLFDGACEGRIALGETGRGGFGYDPLFIPDCYDRSFGELSEAVKNQLSHRARALGKLRAWFAQPGKR